MTDAPSPNTLDTDPLTRIDPFVAMMDGRRQLAEAIAARTRDAANLAETLAIVAAHDQALTEVALAYVRGERDFDDVVAPSDRVLAVDDFDAAMVFRNALFEALAELADALDDLVATPWSGIDTWRMHLVSLAMHDGAHAHALLTADAER